MGTAGERDVPSSCRGPCLIERLHDAIGDEDERRAPDAAVVRGQVRQHENRVMVRRVRTPPAVSRIVPHETHLQAVAAPQRMGVRLTAMKGDRVVLRDGSVVLIRKVQSGDEPLLADGFARLSCESRQLRFLSGKSSLTAAELRYFTEIDHHNHEALGVLNPADGRGLGIARYIRNAEDPEVAEVAVTVVDSWQRRGLGTELLSRLADRARQEGIRRFTALVAAENTAVVRLLQDSGIGIRVTQCESGTVEYEITLPPRGLGDGLHTLLRAFGRRQFNPPASIRDTLAALTPEDLTGRSPGPGS